ncbi:MAG: hypothetical protein K0R28_3536 [Paenibacillus sp.]|nr:hypothetical protein [Paenibacillus sp.]
MRTPSMGVISTVKVRSGGWQAPTISQEQGCPSRGLKPRVCRSAEFFVGTSRPFLSQRPKRPTGANARRRNLRLAYRPVVQNGGASGVDGVTVAELQAYLVSSFISSKTNGERMFRQRSKNKALPSQPFDYGWQAFRRIRIEIMEKHDDFTFVFTAAQNVANHSFRSGTGDFGITGLYIPIKVSVSSFCHCLGYLDHLGPIPILRFHHI